MGVLKEIWTGELINKFRDSSTFLAAIMDRSDLVNNNVIHMVDVGADPAVLINNNTYPIPVVEREDGDIAISLDKFDTENTPVTDDELYALSYDKIGSVIEQHNLVLEENTTEKALHALAPLENTTNTPVISTTGSDDGDGIKAATMADIRKMKRKFDDLKVPKSQRHLVLCPEHLQHLLAESENFESQYQNTREGQILKLYGFQIHEMAYSPVYDKTSLEKNAFSAATGVDDRNASVFFYGPRCFKAMGTVKMFWAEAEKDPQYRRNVVGFKVYFTCLPKKALGFGALVSADA